MYNSANLLFFSENRTAVQNQVRSLMVECGIPFRETGSISQVFSALENPNYYAVILISTQELYNTVINTTHLLNATPRLFVLYPHQVTTGDFFNNYCETTISSLKNFLITNIKNFNICVRPQPPVLIQKLVRLELEKLGIGKKYIGFKYIVDLLVNALCNKIFDAYDNELFEYVASINLTTPQSIERDIRHMLLTTWKSSPYFKNTLSTIPFWENEVNAKNILNNLILYLRQVL